MSDSETLPRATSYESSSAMILICGKSLKKKRYEEELAQKEELLNKLIQDAKGNNITLVYSSGEAI